MNQRIKFLEVILSDLVSDRDIFEMDLNYVLNKDDKKSSEKKHEFNEILEKIVNTNNKIKTLTEYLSTSNQEDFVVDNKDSNNNNN